MINNSVTNKLVSDIFIALRENRIINIYTITINGAYIIIKSLEIHIFVKLFSISGCATTTTNTYSYTHGNNNTKPYSTCHNAFGVRIVYDFLHKLSPSCNKFDKFTI